MKRKAGVAQQHLRGAITIRKFALRKTRVFPSVDSHKNRFLGLIRITSLINMLIQQNEFMVMIVFINAITHLHLYSMLINHSFFLLFFTLRIH